MERLTEKCWRNLDPWECCGQDKYCQRGCHDEGGCTNGCKVPKMYCKLAKYEDLEEQCITENQCDLRMLLLKWKEFFDDIAELYEYRAIGTVEELRELKEKATAKKPKMRHVKPYDSYNDGWCPCCEAYVQEVDFDKYFCQNCGQKLDWSEGKE